MSSKQSQPKGANVWGSFKNRLIDKLIKRYFEKKGEHTMHTHQTSNDLHTHFRPRNKVFDSVLDLVGGTPVVKLNSYSKAGDHQFYAKLEFLNPGGSVKDRIGLALIEDAEDRGLLKPGGTIVEATSGNTGVGLAIAAAVKGYRCIFVMPDKMSQEKVSALQAFGAQVVITPSGLEPEDPRSHYSVARTLAKRPNHHLTEQYDNLANRRVHERTTGPEVLEQLPEINVFVGGMGTGGTLCGTGAYLKKKNPNIKVVCADPRGSIIYEQFKFGETRTPPAPYLVEGIGEDFLPKNFDFKVIDDVIVVEDKETCLNTRNLLHKEGLYVGMSSGAALQAALQWANANPVSLMQKPQHILVLFPDSGDRYMSKVWNDTWMENQKIIQGPNQKLLPVLKVEGAKGSYEVIPL